MGNQHYSGSCQCGIVSFEADLDLTSTIICNCSRCQRLGSVLTFTPLSNFSLKGGEDNLTAYLFNKHKIKHLFCKTCGIQTFAYAKTPDGTDTVAVNVNCLDTVDPRQLKSHHYNGKET